MNQLKHAQQQAEVIDIKGSQLNENEALEVWDDIIYEPVNDVSESGPAPAPHPSTSAPAPSASTSAPIPAVTKSKQSQSSNSSPLPIEDQILSLPSNGNIDPVHRELECRHRIALAEHHLNQIRNLIAEKSFQFSHLIRVAPRKAVATRSRAAVKKLNQQIAVHCRMYSRCRSRILSLGAGAEIQSRLRVLSPSDIGASTAIVNPNEQGSTTISLSWIWQSAGGHRFGLASNDDVGPDVGAGEKLVECEYIYIYIITNIDCFIVRRVHWLRARALFMRWQEEVTLTRYEMQWTVAFFVYKSKKWDNYSGNSAGTIAYARRKKAMWLQRAIRAERTFSLLNNSYQSQL